MPKLKFFTTESDFTLRVFTSHCDTRLVKDVGTWVPNAWSGDVRLVVAEAWVALPTFDMLKHWVARIPTAEQASAIGKEADIGRMN